MTKQLYTPSEVAAILSSQNVVRDAQIFEESTQKPFKVQTMTFALDTAKLSTQPFKVGFPFKSVYVQTATDTGTSVSILLGTMSSFQSPVSLYKNDALDFDEPVAEAYIYWSAQASKSITLIFFIDANFRSGSFIQTLSGGVSITSGSTLTGPQSTNLSAATAAIVCPVNASRKTATIQNQTGSDIWVAGDNTVTNAGATQGIKVADSGIIYWSNSAALYAYSVAGGRVNYIEET